MQTQGTPQRHQVSNTAEDIHQHSLGQCVVQAFGSGAFVQLARLSAWCASSAGVEGFRSIGATCLQTGEIQDSSEAVASGREERAMLTLTLAWTDIYQIAQPTIQEIPVTVLADNPEVHINFVVTK